MISSGKDVWGEEVLLSLRGFWAHIFTSAAHMTSLNKTAAAAAAKLLQSCPTLCDPMDYSPSGSFIHGIFQARVLEWV